MPQIYLPRPVLDLFHQDAMGQEATLNKDLLNNEPDPEPPKPLDATPPPEYAPEPIPAPAPAPAPVPAPAPLPVPPTTGLAGPTTMGGGGIMELYQRAGLADATGNLLGGVTGAGMQAAQGAGQAIQSGAQAAVGGINAAAAPPTAAATAATSSLTDQINSLYATAGLTPPAEVTTTGPKTPEQLTQIVTSVKANTPAPTPSSGGGLSNLSQFGDAQLTANEANAACGPAAAVRFAQLFGRNPTLREATDLAAQVGWTSGQGMAGLGSEKALLDKLGVSTRLVSGPDWGTFANEARTGNPVIISTAGHYFSADNWNPETNQFHVGQSGLDLRQGKEWMTPEEMTAVMGGVQGGLLADHPNTPKSTTSGAVGGLLGAARHAVNMPEVTLDTTTPEAFVKSITPAAKWVASQTGIPAEAMIAMAINETGYGKHAPGNNLFGIKGSGPDGSTSSQTWEDYGNGPVQIVDNFRRYTNVAQSFQDFVEFLRTNSRYKDVMAMVDQGRATVEGFVQGLKNAGYMTDPAYVSKITSIVNNWQPTIDSAGAAVGGAASTTGNSMASALDTVRKTGQQQVDDLNKLVQQGSDLLGQGAKKVTDPIAEYQAATARQADALKAEGDKRQAEFQQRSAASDAEAAQRRADTMASIYQPEAQQQAASVGQQTPVQQAGQQIADAFSQMFQHFMGGTQGGPMTPGQQPTPSDTLTNPLGTGNAPAEPSATAQGPLFQGEALQKGSYFSPEEAGGGAGAEPAPGVSFTRAASGETDLGQAVAERAKDVLNYTPLGLPGSRQALEKAADWADIKPKTPEQEELAAGTRQANLGPIPVDPHVALAKEILWDNGIGVGLWGARQGAGEEILAQMDPEYQKLKLEDEALTAKMRGNLDGMRPEEQESARADQALNPQDAQRLLEVRRMLNDIRNRNDLQELAKQNPNLKEYEEKGKEGQSYLAAALAPMGLEAGASGALLFGLSNAIDPTGIPFNALEAAKFLKGAERPAREAAEFAWRNVERTPEQVAAAAARADWRPPRVQGPGLEPPSQASDVFSQALSRNNRVRALGPLGEALQAGPTLAAPTLREAGQALRDLPGNVGEAFTRGAEDQAQAFREGLFPSTPPRAAAAEEPIVGNAARAEWTPPRTPTEVPPPPTEEPRSLVERMRDMLRSRQEAKVQTGFGTATDRSIQGKPEPFESWPTHEAFAPQKTWYGDTELGTREVRALADNSGFQKVGPQEFYDAIKAVAAKPDPEAPSRLIADTLSTYSPQEYAQMDTYMSKNGGWGYALKPTSDGHTELVSVFKDPSAPKGAGYAAVADAVGRGANRLDAFDIDSRLPKLYSRFGFVETDRAAWNPAYNAKPYVDPKTGKKVTPKGLYLDEDTGKWVTPDVVTMERDTALARQSADEQHSRLLGLTAREAAKGEKGKLPPGATVVMESHMRPTRAGKASTQTVDIPHFVTREGDTVPLRSPATSGMMGSPENRAFVGAVTGKGGRKAFPVGKFRRSDGGLVPYDSPPEVAFMSNLEQAKLDGNITDWWRSEDSPIAHLKDIQYINTHPEKFGYGAYRGDFVIRHSDGSLELREVKPEKVIRLQEEYGTSKAKGFTGTLGWHVLKKAIGVIPELALNNTRYRIVDESQAAKLLKSAPSQVLYNTPRPARLPSGELRGRSVATFRGMPGIDYRDLPELETHQPSGSGNLPGHEVIRIIDETSQKAVEMANQGASRAEITRFVRDQLLPTADIVGRTAGPTRMVPRQRVAVGRMLADMPATNIEQLADEWPEAHDIIQSASKRGVTIDSLSAQVGGAKPAVSFTASGDPAGVEAISAELAQAGKADSARVMRPDTSPEKSMKGQVAQPIEIKSPSPDVEAAIEDLQQSLGDRVIIEYNNEGAATTVHVLDPDPDEARKAAELVQQELSAGGVDTTLGKQTQVVVSDLSEEGYATAAARRREQLGETPYQGAFPKGRDEPRGPGANTEGAGLGGGAGEAGVAPAGSGEVLPAGSLPSEPRGTPPAGTSQSDLARYWGGGRLPDANEGAAGGDLAGALPAPSGAPRSAASRALGGKQRGEVALGGAPNLGLRPTVPTDLAGAALGGYAANETTPEDASPLERGLRVAGGTLAAGTAAHVGVGAALRAAQRGRALAPEAAAVARAGRQAGQVATGLEENTGPLGGALDRWRRMFHGTGSTFESPNPARFDAEGLYGPGYYLTSDPRIAGGVVAGGGEAATPNAARLFPNNPLTGRERAPGEVIARGYAQEQAPTPQLHDALTEQIDMLRSQLQRTDLNETGRANLEELLAQREDQLRSSAGPNIRPVDVPENMNMFDAESPLSQQQADAIGEALWGPNGARPLEGGLDDPEIAQELASWVNGDARGRDVYDTILGEVGDKAKVNEVLRDAGFDGIAHGGGQIMPMVDEAGNDIEHDVNVVFPHALPKIRNALSMRQGGAAATEFAGGLAAGAAGGAAGYNLPEDENAPAWERPARTAAGVAAGLFGVPAVARSRPGSFGYGALQRSVQAGRASDIAAAQAERATAATTRAAAGKPKFNSPQFWNDRVDDLVTYTTGNMLSGLGTAAQNTVSGAAQTLARPGAALLGGRPVDAARDVIMMGRSLGDAVSAYVQAARSGIGATNPAEARAWGNEGNIVGRGVGGALSMGLRNLTATDEFFRVLNGAGGAASRASKALRDNPGLDMAGVLAKHEPDILEAGKKAGREAVYAEGGGPMGTWGEALASWRQQLLHDADPGKKALGAVLQWLTPMTSVPGRALGHGLSVTPGFSELYTAGQLTKAAIKRDPELAYRAVRREAIAGAMNYAILGEVLQGNITGDGPMSPTEKRAKMEAVDENGNPTWRPNSIRVGDRWFDYSSLPGVNVPMAMIANAVDEANDWSQKPAGTRGSLPELGGSIAGATGRTLANAWYLRNLGDVLDAVKSGGLERVGSSILSTGDRLVPAGGVVNEARKLTDPIQREASNIPEHFENRIPGLSRSVPPRYAATTGQPLEDPRDLLGTLGRGPAAGQMTPNPVAMEIARLNDAGQSVGVTPPTDEYKGAKQAPEQKTLLQKTLGQAANLYTLNVLASPAYANATDEQKAQALKSAVRQSKDAADIDLGSRVARSPHESALVAWAQTPHYVTVKGTPLEIQRGNFEIKEAKAKLAAYTTAYGVRGLGRLRQDDPDAFKKAQVPEVDSTLLAMRKKKLDEQLGGALLEGAKQPPAGLVGVGSNVLDLAPVD